MATIFQVAHYFLHKSMPNSEYAITHLKLQKLVYYAQAWYLAMEGKPLFQERIEAWIHGPVCPNLYDQYKVYGLEEIPAIESPTHSFSHREIEILDAVWETYGSYDGRYLEELTHSEAPWLEARASLAGHEYSNTVISHSSMQQFYSSFLHKEQE